MSANGARAHLLAIAAASAFVVAACGATPAPQRAEPAPPSRSSEPETGLTGVSPVQVPEILRFEAPLLGGGVLHGADFAGSDVAIWFWAPW